LVTFRWLEQRRTMGMQCWDYLDTVEVIGSIPVAPMRKVK